MKNSNFIIDDNNLIEYLGNNKNVIIPSNVININDRAFKNNTKIK